LIKDLRDEGFRGRIAVGDGATDGPLLANLTPAQSKDVYGTALLFPEFMPELADWSARYRAANGTAPGPSTVEAYDAVNVALDAIKIIGPHELTLKNDAGSAVEWNRRTLIPLYHPSPQVIAAQRGIRLQLQHFQLLGKLLRIEANGS